MKNVRDAKGGHKGREIIESLNVTPPETFEMLKSCKVLSPFCHQFPALTELRNVRST